MLPNHDYELLVTKKEMAGLANYISGGIMSQAGIQRACRALTNFRALLEQMGIGEMHVFATASLRNIQNTEEAAAEILAQTGVAVEVISGDLEAELGYYGALKSWKKRDGAMFDIGGGSTELVEVREGRIRRAQSLPIGSLNLFNRCVSKIWPKPSELEAMEELVEEALSRAKLPSTKARWVCGVGGTARAMLKIAGLWYGRPDSQRCLIPREVHQLTKLLQRQDKQARQLILNACPDRLHTILPGALLLDAVCGALCGEELYISKFGVREGYLYHKLLGEDGRAEP